jgi:hypothetical protein
MTNKKTILHKLKTIKRKSVYDLSELMELFSLSQK